MSLANQLIISETFFSIQGEGPYTGRPAVFLRLSGCNLRCKGFSYKHPISGEQLGCDTAHVWQTGRKYTISNLITEWKQKQWLEKLKQGAHLVITGGEPTLQQTALTLLINTLDTTLGYPSFIEMETNATFPCTDFLLQRINQINASPKLRHSGEPRHKAYQPEILHTLAQHTCTIFKFVVSHESDIAEILTDYVKPLQLSHQRIWLMPEGGTIAAISAKAPWVVELCKHHMMHYSPRLHIHIWGETTGV